MVRTIKNSRLQHFCPSLQTETTKVPAGPHRWILWLLVHDVEAKAPELRLRRSRPMKIHRDFLTSMEKMDDIQQQQKKNIDIDRIIDLYIVN